MAGTKVLVPFNFTRQDEKALRYVLRVFSQDKEARITLFHVYSAPPEIDVYSNPALRRLRSNLAAFAGEVREKEDNLEKIRAELVKDGLSEDQMNIVLKTRNHSIGEEIVDIAVEGGYDTVVLSHKPGRITHTFTRSVHEKVLGSLRNKTICVIT